MVYFCLVFCLGYLFFFLDLDLKLCVLLFSMFSKASRSFPFMHLLIWFTAHVAQIILEVSSVNAEFTVLSASVCARVLWRDPLEHMNCTGVACVTL